MRQTVLMFVLSILAVSSSLTASAVADDGAAARATARPAAQRAESGASEDAADAAKRLVLRRAAPRSLAEARRRLDAIRVDVDFREMELREATEFVARLAGFNVIVSPELQKDGALQDMPRITLKLRRASLRQVVDLMTRFTGTALALDGSILVFTTPEAARGKPVLRIYSIAELTAKIMNFPGPDINLRPSGAEFEQEEPSEVESELADPEKIVEMIQSYVESETWTDEGVSISADRRKLVVRTYPHVQRRVARFLALLRAAR